MLIADIKDPRQLNCLALYRNPKSETFGNLKQSAILSGYDDKYADNLHGENPKWLSAGVKKDVDRVLRAERNMDKILNVDIAFNSKKDVDLARLQFEVTKFVLKTLAKQKYSEEGEAEKPSVTINITNYGEPKAQGAVTDVDNTAKNNDIVENVAQSVLSVNEAQGA